MHAIMAGPVPELHLLSVELAANLLWNRHLRGVL